MARPLLLLLLLTACGGDDSPPDANLTPPAGCVDRIADTAAFALDPDGLPTQIHVAHALDGDGLWIAWSAVDPSSAFVVIAGRMSCDGGWDLPPLQIGGASGEQHLDPTVAVGPQGALVAWQVDNGASGDNLDIHAALIGRDGQMVREAGPLQLTRGGAPHAGPDWMPHAAALPGGGFALVGSFGIPEAPSFQVFLQYLDDAGGLDGDAIVLDLQPGLSQTVPAVAAYDASLVVTWESTDWATTEVAVAAVVGDEVVLLQHVEGAAPDVAVGRTGDWTVWSVPSAPSIRVAGPAGETATLGASGELEFGPAVSVGEAHVAVVWYRNNSGFDNALRIAWLDLEGAIVAERRLRAGGAPPYDLNVTHVGADTWFVAWQEGANPDFRVHGQFVTLP